MRNRVAGDAAGVIDVRIEIALGERARRTKHRLPPVQTGIARARHRPPLAALAIDEDDVVEAVDRIEAEQQRGIAVLLERASSKQSRFQAMRWAVSYPRPEASERVAV